MLEQLRTRLFSLVGRSRVAQTNTSTPTVIKVQTDFSRHQGLVDGIPQYQHFGFASYLPAGTDVLVVFDNGDLVNGTVVASNSQAYRPPTGLQEGDSVVHDVRGVFLWLTENGPVLDAGGLDAKVQNAKTIEITASDSATVTAPSVTVSASKSVTLDTPMVEAKQAFKVDACPSGVFTTADGHTVTFTNGVITGFV